MNQKQADCYVRLIDTILNSPPEQEINILKRNPQLIDEELISNLIIVADRFTKSNKLEDAERLNILAKKLLDLKNHNFPRKKGNQYFQFLIATLEKIAQREPVIKISEFLSCNHDKLDLELAKIIRSWGTKTFLNLPRQEAQTIARDFIDLANLILEYPKGNKVYNIEIALTTYETALQVYTPIIDPKNWAIVQSNLGNAYRDRVKGNSQENLDRAIFHYHAALEVLTPQKSAYRWGIIQRNLGMAYAHSKTDNLAIAIAHYNNALSVHKLDDFPQDWAAAHNNLGDAYLNFKIGNKRENIEVAIYHFQESLSVYNKTDFSHLWAMVNNNLGNAFQVRIEGNQRDNLNKAIAFYQEALSVHTLENAPYNWGMLQNNLAGVYRRLAFEKETIESGKNNQQKYFTQAVLCLQNAATIYTQSAFPEKWQTIQRNLQNIYQIQKTQ